MSQGLKINISYDSSVASAPAGFTAAIGYVVNFLESIISNPVTLNVDVGFGEIDGQAVSPDALGESMTNAAPAYTYSQIRNALVGTATSTADATAVASLPVNDPSHGGNFDVGTADAKALGLMPGSSGAIDGWVGFSNMANTFTFDPNNRVVPGQYDFIGTAFHEITEVMGRYADLGSFSSYSHAYSGMDLFRYAGAGIRELVGGTSSYFSIDGGNTNLDNFNTSPSGDYGDWAASAGNDALLAFSGSGVMNAFTSADLTLLDAIGWNTLAPTIAADYKTILQRPAGIAEQNGWVLAQAGAGLTDAQVRGLIENSQEAVQYVDPVVRLYQAAFDRVPDQGGLTVNVDALHAVGSDLAIAQAFVFASEFAAHYGGTTVNSAFISALYQNVLGRSGSPAEILSWQNSGNDAAHLLIGFSDSSEFIAESHAATLTFLDAAAQGSESYAGPLLTHSGSSMSIVGVASASTPLEHLA
jgi:hypothetical protein